MITPISNYSGYFRGDININLGFDFIPDDFESIKLGISGQISF